MESINKRGYQIHACKMSTKLKNINFHNRCIFWDFKSNWYFTVYNNDYTTAESVMQVM